MALVDIEPGDQEARTEYALDWLADAAPDLSARTFLSRGQRGAARGASRQAATATGLTTDFSTIGSKAAAKPPVTGSLAFPRETRFETTTRLTGFPS